MNNWMMVGVIATLVFFAAGCSKDAKPPAGASDAKANEMKAPKKAEETAPKAAPPSAEASEEEAEEE